MKNPSGCIARWIRLKRMRYLRKARRRLERDIIVTIWRRRNEPGVRELTLMDPEVRLLLVRQAALRFQGERRLAWARS